MIFPPLSLRNVMVDCYRFLIVIAATICAFWVALSSAAQAAPYSDEEVIRGFNKTVFGSEYANPFAPSYVRKFSGPVRFFVRSTVGNNRKAEVQSFVSRLRGLIRGLRVQLVRRETDANFVVHIVRRREYEATVRKYILNGSKLQVLGRCLVRSKFSSSGISRSDAVIVADEGNSLFRRCMTEEILQGLGPLNDDRSLKYSMFNDTSRYTSFRRYDRLILNMLYDPSVKIGATQSEVAPLLPGVLRRIQRRLGR